MSKRLKFSLSLSSPYKALDIKETKPKEYMIID